MSIGTEAGLFFFFSVAVCIFEIASLDYLMGKLSQTSWASCLEGWRRGRMQALEMDLDGASHVVLAVFCGLAQAFDGFRWAKPSGKHRGRCSCHMCRTCLLHRDQGGVVEPALPHRAAMLACPWPTGRAPCMARPKFSTRICSAWPQNWRVHAYRDVCSAAGWAALAGMLGAGKLSIHPPGGVTKTNEYRFLLPCLSPQQESLCPASPVTQTSTDKKIEVLVPPVPKSPLTCGQELGSCALLLTFRERLIFSCCSLTWTHSL